MIYNFQIDNDQIVWENFDGNDTEIYLNRGINITNLSDNDYDDNEPQIDKGKVVWWGGPYYDENIYFYDGTQTTKLSSGGNPQRHPQISDGQIVWEGYGYEIYFYNGVQTIKLTNNGNNYDPQISNGQIVWERWNGINYVLYFNDGSQTIQLANDPYDMEPKIDNGQVVWRTWDGNDFEIYLYKGSQIYQLTDNEYNDMDAQINNGQVVWNGYDGNDYEIYLYDGKLVIPLTDNNESDRYPQIDKACVVWEGWDGTNDEIFMAIPGAPTLKSVGVYYRHELTNNSIPVIGYPTTKTTVNVKAIVWADDGNGEKPYTLLNQDEEINDGKWYATGSEGSQAGSGMPNLSVPVLSVSDVPKIYKWSDTWQQPNFEWKILFNRADTKNTTGHNKNYKFKEYINPFWSNGWGYNNKLLRGTWKFKVKAILDKGTPEEQFVVSADTECATRISVLDSTAPNDPYGGNGDYIRWLTTYLEVPYEWGGHWFGGEEGQNVGGAETYDGFGTDCAGLVSNGARWEGFNWNTWRAYTFTLKYGPDWKIGTSDDNYYSQNINKSKIKVGHILNRVTQTHNKIKYRGHVATIWAVRDGGIKKGKIVDVIEATGNKVTINKNRNLKTYYLDQYYELRELNRH